MDVFVVGVGLANIAGQAVYCQVHTAEAHGLGGLLLPIDGDFVGGVLLVVLHEAGALHKHAARTAGGVEDAPVKGFDDLDDQFDNGGGGEKFAAFLAFGHGEFAQEVFVNFAEDIAFDVHGYL